MLAVFSIVGIVAFVYGYITMDVTEEGYLHELCSLDNITMCPMCDDGCAFTKASDNCFNAKVLHMFDNNFTLVYSCIVSLWAIIFLELWKRTQFELSYKWNTLGTDNFYESRLRPQYIAEAEKHKRPRKYYPALLKSLLRD